ncbi:hypothetical protein KCP70_09460 [Salmonella enterica subsp. enterica]|nr:hypothetical protein KCP70_09460 [Salmonella enterica subsp. enterica]
MAYEAGDMIGLDITFPKKVSPGVQETTRCAVANLIAHWVTPTKSF